MTTFVALRELPAALEAGRLLDVDRAVLRERLVAGGGAFVATGALAAADGAYFPTSWGWAGLGFAWVAVVALLLGTRSLPGRTLLALVATFAALTAWIGLSTLWSATVPATAYELERALVYLAALLAAAALVRRASLAAVAIGIWAGTVVVCGYALLTRLFPEYLGPVSQVAGYRLFEPLGYWNGLALLAAMGALLALALAARAEWLPLRSAAAASLAVLLPTLLFTFSRGGWLALALGVAAAIALDPRRLQLVTTALVALPAPLLAAWLCSQSALSRFDLTAAEAVTEGRQLAALAALLGLAAAAIVAVLAHVERSVPIAPRARDAYARTLLLGLVAVVVAVPAHFGNPATLAANAYRDVLAPPARPQENLTERLFDLSASGRQLQWRVAWEQARANPVLGGGAGSFEQAWLSERTVPGKVRDAHSLYLETLGELGPVGLLLLLGALGIPLAATFRARSTPLVPVLAAAYVAFLAHAAIDWDWELPGLTVPALLIGAALAAAAPEAPVRSHRIRLALAGGAAAVGALAFAGLVGNVAIDRSTDAATAERWQQSERWARTATRYAPWAAEGWRRLALAQDDAASARPHFRRALARDPRSWELWLEYAWSLQGAEQQAALARAEALNPLSPEIAQFRAQLAAEAKEKES